MDDTEGKTIREESGGANETGKPKRIMGRRSRREKIKTRDAEAARLRSIGYSYAAIAEKTGYADPSGAYRAVRRIVDMNAMEPVEEARLLELVRLDEIHREAWHLMRTTEGQTKLRAIDRVLAIAERRTRLLGMDAPTKHERTVRMADNSKVTESDLDMEIKRLTEELETVAPQRELISDPVELEEARRAMEVEDRLKRDVDALGDAAGH